MAKDLDFIDVPLGLAFVGEFSRLPCGGQRLELRRVVGF